ncbi:MAG: GTP-binding DUF697 domain-containing protein [Lachnospiraceae bacterium]|nr:GTP-binding DUF697 domain-containing protein [Lachnospiraceae bacterium]
MNSFYQTDIAANIMEAIAKEKKDMKVLNVMLLGKTGVGKSTLINNLFNERLAETGIGKPVTQDIRRYEKEGFPLVVYDTPGFELGGENAMNRLLDSVNSEIKKGYKSFDIEKSIHCILYCVSATSHRFEDIEVNFIKKFLDENKDVNIPVIIVITQALSKKDASELKSCIEAENLGVTQVIPVLAEDYEIDENTVIKANGLDNLADVIYEVIPEALKKTYVAVQKASLNLKVKKSHAIVVGAAASAAATGAVPIPIADAFVLVPEQVAMIASITNVFGFSLEKSAITAIVSATLGTAGTTVAGKTVVSSILKLIPGAGSVAGGAISGAVAAALTAALGEAYIGVMMAVAKGKLKIGDLSTSKGKKFITDAFKKALKLKRDSKGEPIEDAKDSKKE